MFDSMKIKHVSSHPITGMRRWEIKSYEASQVFQWLEGKGLDPRQVIRGLRIRKDGSISFKTGGGYAIIDMDLLGGNGDGRAEDQFVQDRFMSISLV